MKCKAGGTFIQLTLPILKLHPPNSLDDFKSLAYHSRILDFHGLQLGRKVPFGMDEDSMVQRLTRIKELNGKVSSPLHVTK